MFFGSDFKGEKICAENDQPKETSSEPNNIEMNNVDDVTEIKDWHGMEMDGTEQPESKKSSKEKAKVPLHLLSQRKLRKLQMKQKQNKLKKSKKFLKW